jgi:putative Ca2+/H+ antiporter (TMEM165/GDT1 family)
MDTFPLATAALSTGTVALAEIGDKTQVATVLLAARYSPLWEVVAGTTAGMLLANVPVVLFGARFAHCLPLKAARWAAAALFAVLGLWVAIAGM